MSPDVETWAIDELERVLEGNTVRSPRAEYVGGEWDHLKALPLPLKRRLIGGRYLTSGGLLPDQAAELVRDKVAGVDTTCDAMAWYVSTCRAAIDQTRRVAEQRRYAARVKRAAAAGQDSYHYHRLARTVGVA